MIHSWTVNSQRTLILTRTRFVDSKRKDVDDLLAASLCHSTQKLKNEKLEEQYATITWGSIVESSFRCSLSYFRIVLGGIC